MVTLPVEIWYDIMSRLSADDLISCSKVCTEWRQFTDDDSLWRPLCLEKKWNRIHQTSDVSDTEYGRACKWRQIYELNHELSCNWKNKNWTLYSLASHGQRSNVFSISSDTRYLAIGYQNGTAIVWNLSSKASILATVLCVLPNYPVLDVKMSGRRLAAVQDRLVQIFDIGAGDATLLRVICLDLGPSFKDLTHSYGELPYFHSWYRECLRVNEVKATKRLVTALSTSQLVVSTGDEGSVHVWSFESNEIPCKSIAVEGKIKELLSWDDTVYIVAWERKVTRVFEFSAGEGCLDLLIESSNPCDTVLSEKFVLTVPSEGGFTLQRLRVWSRNTGAHIGSQFITSMSTRVCITDSSIVIYTQNSEILVWDPIRELVLHRIAILSSAVSSLYVNFIDASFSDFLVVLLDNNAWVYDWKEGTRLYSITSRLQWTQDYINLIWTCPTGVVVGDDPLSSEDISTPDFSDSDESMILKEVAHEKSLETCCGSTDIEEFCDKLAVQEPSDEVPADLSKELEQILSDLSKNSFRECVAEVLGTRVESEESLPDKKDVLVDCANVVVDKRNRIDDNTFVYDTSSGDESVIVPVVNPRKISADISLKDGYVGKLAPWREIFPPHFHVNHYFAERALYWMSTALKHSALDV